jgi:hypothetical protein
MIGKQQKFREMNLGERIGVIAGGIVISLAAIAVVVIVLGLLWRAVKAVWS